MENFNLLKNALEQLIAKGNMEIVDSSFSDNYVAHSGEKSYRGHEFIKRYAKEIRRAIPDVKISGVKLLLQGDNTIAWERRFCGTHKTALKGIPASNKRVTWSEMVVSRFENDKIVEEWVISELAFQLMVKN